MKREDKNIVYPPFSLQKSWIQMERPGSSWWAERIIIIIILLLLLTHRRGPFVLPSKSHMPVICWKLLQDCCSLSWTSLPGSSWNRSHTLYSLWALRCINADCHATRYANTTLFAFFSTPSLFSDIWHMYSEFRLNSVSCWSCATD